MSLSDLASGGACGPTNALQQLGKRFGQDRSTQLDRYGNVGGGPSGPSGMRTARPGAAPPGMTLQQQHVNGDGGRSFDLSALGQNLPRQQHQTGSHFGSGFTPSQGSPMNYSPAFNAAFQSPARGGSPAAVSSAAPPAWAADFMAASVPAADHKFMQARQAANMQQHAQTAGPSRFGPQQMHFQQQAQADAYSFLQQPQMMPTFQQPAFQTVAPAHAAAAPQANDAQWASAFTALEAEQVAQAQAILAKQNESAARSGNADLAARHLSAVLENATKGPQEARSQEQIPPADADELAQAAGKLVATVEGDQSDKFKKSNFLELMRRIRDKQAGIRGTDIVDTPEGSTSAPTMSTMDKGKGKERAVDDDVRERFRRPETAQEAYRWASEMAATGQSSVPASALSGALGRTSSHTYDASKHMPIVPGPSTLENETIGRAELAEMWAEDDARLEALEIAKVLAAREQQQREEQRRKAVFIGDGGDVEAREREDLFAALTAEDELRAQEQQRQRDRAAQQEDPEAAEFARFQRLGTQIPGADQAWTEKAGDAQDTSDTQSVSSDFVGREWEPGTKGRGVRGAQASEWGKLQADWDAWDASAAGMQRASSSQQAAQSVPQYVFQRDNPYLATTHHHAHHAEMPQQFESLLESEARVQANPNDAGAWLDLGIKQQENEREPHAIAALRKAVELDPKLRGAWLALAVSYTNENDRAQAFDAIEQWIQTADQYVDVVRQHRGEGITDASTAATPLQRHLVLTETLMAIARHGIAGGDLDVDIQIALGVLFNASEEYEKAVDCFETALQVRQDDWLLYNRLGATLSNSGKSNEAISWYHKALQLQPNFVRCHFNLSISYLNLKFYKEAAEHIYSALSIQASQSAHLQPESDGKEAGVGSYSLWETFRVALELMDRPDLANLCSTRDISKFDPADLVPKPRESAMEM